MTAAEGINASIRVSRQIIVTVVGVGVLVIGVTLIILPGPSSLVLPLGLAILATEFYWARRMLQGLKDSVSRILGWPTPEKIIQ
ncbi:MAG: PGPGW domain-containing protein [Candidatus Ozemobacteraceae bacterium]